MAKWPNKRLEDSDQPLPESPDFGKADRAQPSSRKPNKTSPPLPAPLCQAVTRFAKSFRQEHGLQDRSAADRIARMLKASITPRRPKGRPVSPGVRRAAEMRQQGTEWRAVYAAVIPDFSGMDKYQRAYWTPRLRRNVNAYMKRRGLQCKRRGVE